MSRTLKRLMALALCLVIVAAVVAITRGDVVAQIRAALVKNVDEPWRTPWETRSAFLPKTAGGCFMSSDCFNLDGGTTYTIFDLRPVPAGKRWVVQSVTGGLTDAAGKIVTIELRSNRGGIIFDGAKWLYGGPYTAYSAFDSRIFSANVNVTFGPGETPVVRVDGDPLIPAYSVLVFSGYLIDASN